MLFKALVKGKADASHIICYQRSMCTCINIDYSIEFIDSNL